MLGAAALASRHQLQPYAQRLADGLVSLLACLDETKLGPDSSIGIK
jgi:hypothetical protein